jgi:hypothetical protein
MTTLNDLGKCSPNPPTRTNDPKPFGKWRQIGDTHIASDQGIEASRTVRAAVEQGLCLAHKPDIPNNRGIEELIKKTEEKNYLGDFSNRECFSNAKGQSHSLQCIHPLSSQPEKQRRAKGESPGICQSGEPAFYHYHRAGLRSRSEPPGAPVSPLQPRQMHRRTITSPQLSKPLQATTFVRAT